MGFRSFIQNVNCNRRMGSMRFPILPSRVLLSLTMTLSCMLIGCHSSRKAALPAPTGRMEGGSDFYRQAAAYGWRQRDSLALDFLKRGNLPSFNNRFVPMRQRLPDSSGRQRRLLFFVSPDYFMVGTDRDFARVPLTAPAAQKIADETGCFLPTRRIVDMVHRAAKVKLEPVPMYAFRDSTVTMWQHHLIIEGQRKGRKGLISGIKKDVVVCTNAPLKDRSARVAIYGWHRSDGKAIQPLYAGHVDWYADYSHGVRLVLSKMKLDGRWNDHVRILSDPLTRPLLSDETEEVLLRYPLVPNPRIR